MDPAILDLDYLRRQTAGDRALEHELLRLLDGQCARLLPILTASRDTPERREAAHSLRGAAAALGARQVATMAERLERADDADESAMGEAIVAVRSAIARLVAAGST